MIGVGAMIGAGIFVLTGIAAGAAGPALIVAFALNGIITVFTGMVYAELGSAIPEAGGGYLWVREGLPGPNAFLAGWMSWFAHGVAGSLYGLGFGSYFHLVLAEAGLPISIPTGMLEKGLAVVIILTFLFINYRGSSETGLAGIIITFVKIAILILFIGSGLKVILGAPAEHLAQFDDFLPEGFGGVLSAMGLTFIAFEGYEIIVQAGEETKNPRQTIPKAVFYSLAIVIPIYMLVAFVSIGAVTLDSGQPIYQWLGEHKELGLVEVARQFMPFGTVLLLLGGLFSTMSALNATTYSSTRVSFAMGRDKNLPDAFAEISERTRTPHKALAFTGALILTMALAIPIQDVAAAADIMFMLLFLQVNVAVISLRRRYGDRLKYGYLMPFFPAIPIIGIVTKLFLAVYMFNYSAIAWYFALGWIGLGVLFFYVYARRHKTELERTPLIERLQQTPRSLHLKNDFAILVPIADERTLDVLLPPAIEAAREEEGSVIVLHVVSLPKQLPLSAGRKYVARARDLMDEARSRIPDDIEAEFLTRIAHGPAKAIIDTADEYDVDLLVAGWRGGSREVRRSVGQNIDQIMQQVNCDALVMQLNATAPRRRMLVSVSEVAQVEASLRLAGYATGGFQGHIDLQYVFDPDATGIEREESGKDLRKAVDSFVEEKGLDSETIRIHTSADRRPGRAVEAVASDYDAVMVGPEKGTWLRRRSFSRMPTRLARAIKAPVLLARAKSGEVGFSLFRLATFVRGHTAPSADDSLEDDGMLRPEAEASEPQHGGVSRVGIVLSGTLGLSSTVVMFAGHGNQLTWIGSGAFLFALAWFTWLSTRGVETTAVDHASH